jgi:hypothetical protein
MLELNVLLYNGVLSECGALPCSVVQSELYCSVYRISSSKSISVHSLRVSLCQTALQVYH